MKVLVANSTDARHSEIMFGLATAFGNPSNEIIFWDKKFKPSFDAFDEFKPDIFLCPESTIDESVDKAVSQSPETISVALGDWTSVPNINKSFNAVSLLVNDHISYFPPAANLTQFCPGHVNNNLKSDMSYIGPFTRDSDKWLAPLYFPLYKYKLKIFDAKPWPTPHYIGHMHDEQQVYRAANIGLNICKDEPKGLTNKPFNILASRSLCVSTPNRELQYILPGFEIHFVHDPLDMDMAINGYMDEKLRDMIYENIVINHSYYARAIKLLQMLGLEEHVPAIKATREKFLCLKLEY